MGKKTITKNHLFRILNQGKILSSKRPEELTDEDLYVASKRFLSFVLTTKSGGSGVDLAARVLSIFRQGGKSAKDLELWQSTVKIEYFLMNSFLPALYHQFEKRGISIELRTFFEKALESDLTTDDVGKLASGAWRVSGMDDIFSGHPVVEEVQEEKPKFRYRGDLLPAYIKNKAQEELTEKEIAMMAKIKLLSAILSGRIDNSSVGAAFKLIENFRKDIKADSGRLWREVVKPLEDFYVSVLYPMIHRGFQLRGDNSPINLVFADALGEVFLLFENPPLPDPLDEAIEKAKRRGKWIKK